MSFSLMNDARSNLTILLLDDESSVVFALSLLLKALRFDVKDFTAPLDAIAYLQKGGVVDLVLCDLKMPQMNGLGVLQEVRKLNKSLPFILMSAHAREDEISEAARLGGNGFLAKPFTPDQLQEAVAKAVVLR